MDFSAEQFVDNLLSDEANDEPSDTVNLEDLEEEMKLPEWFDEKKYNQGRRFYWNFLYGFSMAFMVGVLSLYSIPSLVNVVISTRRSNSSYTAYKRWLSTFFHVFSWLLADLKPDTTPWKSLHTVRVRHVKAGKTAKLKNIGVVSQRDLSLSLFAMTGHAMVQPDKFGIKQLREGDWEAINHLWRTLGYMVGIQDRYNICRPSFHETRQVFRLVADRVFTPCLENVPEYFEHLNYVTITGLSNVIGGLEKTSMIYFMKYLTGVPGYIYTEDDRLKLREKLQDELKGKSLDTGVETAALMRECVVKGLPDKPPRLLYLQDYDTVETSPAYKNLPFIGKYRLAIMHYTMSFYSTSIGRIILNLQFKLTLFFAKYFPYMSMWKYGIKEAFIDMFKEDPKDDTVPKLNSEYNKPAPPEPWYNCILAVLW